MNINNITVLGAGIMGRGIAHVSCFGGFQTVLYDISEEMLESASAGIQKNYDKAVEKNVLTDVQAKEAISKLVLKQDLQEWFPRWILLSGRRIKNLIFVNIKNMSYISGNK